MKPDDIDGSIPVGDEQLAGTHVPDKKTKTKRSKKKEGPQPPETIDDAYTRLSTQMKKEHAAIHRNIRMNDAPMHLLAALVNAHYGIGDMGQALRDATIMVEKHNYIRYSEAQVELPISAAEEIKDLLSQPMIVSRSASAAMQAYFSVMENHYRHKYPPSSPLALSVIISKSLLAALLYGPLAHVGVLPDQKGYGTMNLARRALAQKEVGDDQPLS